MRSARDLALRLRRLERPSTDDAREKMRRQRRAMTSDGQRRALAGIVLKAALEREPSSDEVNITISGEPGPNLLQRMNDDPGTGELIASWAAEQGYPAEPARWAQFAVTNLLASQAGRTPR